jgi:methionine sulfoxide reductase heme-binding subunit
VLRTILNNRYSLWAILAIPGLIMIAQYGLGHAEAADLLHPSGEFSARLMIVAMMIAPLIALLGARRWLTWLRVRRRYFGVSAFGYACLHLILYLIDMGSFADIMAEIGALGIWTGWIAMLLFVPLALTSNNRSMRWLGAGWKRLQRLVYPAALLVLAHWIYVHNNLVPALAHFVPLAIFLVARGLKTTGNHNQPLNNGV